MTKHIAIDMPKPNVAGSMKEVIGMKLPDHRDPTADAEAITLTRRCHGGRSLSICRTALTGRAQRERVQPENAMTMNPAPTPPVMVVLSCPHAADAAHADRRRRLRDLTEPERRHREVEVTVTQDRRRR